MSYLSYNYTNYPVKQLVPEINIFPSSLMTTCNNLSVSTVCLNKNQKLNCKHVVVLPGEKKQTRMFGTKIFEIISENHPMYQHFSIYKDWNFLTKEEQETKFQELQKLDELKTQQDYKRRLHECEIVRSKLDNLL
jgi:hypothetical protein